MKVNEVIDIDLFQSEDSLNLFDNRDFSYSSVCYFDSIYESDFLVDSKTKKTVLDVVSYFLLFVMTIMVLSGVCFIFLTYRSYPKSCVMQTISTIPRRIDGTSVSDEILLDCSQSLTGYFSVYSLSQGYSSLNDYCVNNSVLYTTQEKSREMAVYTLDQHDSYSRLLKVFGDRIVLKRVDEVIENKGTLYCYCIVEVPSIDDVDDYVSQYSYNLTKYFTSNILDITGVSRFMLDSLTKSKISVVEKEIELKLINLNGEYLIVDDTPLLAICNSVYSEFVAQVSKTLGAKLVNDNYEVYNGDIYIN